MVARETISSRNPGANGLEGGHVLQALARAANGEKHPMSYQKVRLFDSAFCSVSEGLFGVNSIKYISIFSS